MSKVLLITGVSGGFGRCLIVEAGKLGYTAYGTVRKQNQIADIDALTPGKTSGVLLDVNDHAAAAKVVDSIVAKHGKLDALINNAGYGLFGAVEEVTMEEAREQMETNFFACLRLTQLVLPHMRKAKSGHIIQVSSQAGISGTPGLGIYNASKFALEGFSEALSKEVGHLNIKVTIVEPGPFRTDWAGSAMKFAAAQIDELDRAIKPVRQRLESYGGETKQPGDPVRGAAAMLSLLSMERAPLRLPLGKIAVGVVRTKLASVAEEVNQHEQLALSADFPHGQ